MKLKHIDRFGIELEGGWEYRPKDAKGDGSVHIDNCGFVGEVVSKPYKSVGHAQRFIRKYYPNKVNETCGFHIHISTKDRNHYLLLTHANFYRDFIIWAKNWNKSYGRDYNLLERINGKNSYCKKNNPSKSKIPYYKQIIDRGSRFRQLNFCWKKHKTLENRLFPMFGDIQVAIHSLDSYLQFVDNWIENHKGRYKDYIESKQILNLELS